jgi:hypothetical protein
MLEENRSNNRPHDRKETGEISCVHSNPSSHNIWDETETHNIFVKGARFKFNDHRVCGSEHGVDKLGFPKPKQWKLEEIRRKQNEILQIFMLPDLRVHSRPFLLWMRINHGKPSLEWKFRKPKLLLVSEMRHQNQNTFQFFGKPTTPEDQCSPRWCVLSNGCRWYPDTPLGDCHCQLVT